MTIDQGIQAPPTAYYCWWCFFYSRGRWSSSNIGLEARILRFGGAPLGCRVSERRPKADPERRRGGSNRRFAGTIRFGGACFRWLSPTDRFADEAFRHFIDPFRSFIAPFRFRDARFGFRNGSSRSDTVPFGFRTEKYRRLIETNLRLTETDRRLTPPNRR